MKYLLIVLVLLGSCNQARQKARNTINKSGEVIGKAGSEFADGVAAGVQQTFENEVQIGKTLEADGLHTGKILISDTDSTQDNVLDVYMIFDKDFDREITVNVLDVYMIFDKDFDREITVKAYAENGLETGRVRQPVRGTREEACYIRFVFDRRTNLSGKGKLVLE